MRRVPVLSEREELGMKDVEGTVVELLRSSGGMDTPSLVRAIVEAGCCSAAEAMQLIRGMSRRGLIARSGGVWVARRR